MSTTSPARAAATGPDGPADKLGAGRRITAESILRALAIPKRGEVIDLDPGRFNGMPRDPLSPPFQMVTYRTPHGVRIDGDIDFLRPEVNPSRTAWIDELLIGTIHCGAHIDALCHVTRGEDDEWYGGFPRRAVPRRLRPTRADASKLPALCAGASCSTSPAPTGSRSSRGLRDPRRGPRARRDLRQRRAAPG